MQNVFTLIKPEKQLPLVFDSPHSGNIYPDDFDYACAHDDLQVCEDHHVDALFAHVTNLGAPLLKAHFPRSYIDPNRAEDDIDLLLLSGEFPYPVKPTSRSESGIGLIRRLVRPGIAVYNRQLSPDEVLHRIQTYYRPYHDALMRLIEVMHYDYGCVFHINCHSMPNHLARPRRPLGLIGNTPKSADFCIGDRDGTTASIFFTQSLRKYIRSLGYSVTINDPFKGVEILRQTGDPARGRHAIQLEINKALYMDEETGQKNANYLKLQHDLESITGFIADFVQSQMNSMAAD